MNQQFSNSAIQQFSNSAIQQFSNSGPNLTPNCRCCDVIDMKKATGGDAVAFGLVWCAAG
jgi:hypothetical protein